MKSEARLDSAVFQLTPTRTRCDLVILANGKTEKLASGLLNPFLAHLKTAQDQIVKGGYSITLEPDSESDPTWFTKGTVERFVRFVSTPEVLERVNTIESEIYQIDEAIAIQSNENFGLNSVDDHQTKSTSSAEGTVKGARAAPDAEKAIVLYEPGAHPSEPNGSTTQEENSKVQLLRVLETRKTVLQKEQGMAFARAVAAGFDMDHMAHLVLFAECFGASRLKEACLSFMELWKAKHETGQWIEIEAAEAISTRSDFSYLNASGILLPSEIRKQTEFKEGWTESLSELGHENNGKTHSDADSSQHLNADHNGDKRPSTDPQVPYGHSEYFQGQFQPPMYQQWPIHPPPGGHVFQPYPIQGMPYYQNYPGTGPFFQPPYPPTDDPRFKPSQRMKHRRHSMDNKGSNTESEGSEMGSRSQDGADQGMFESDKDGSHGRETRRKVGRSGKKKSGVVVIRNINYVTSKKHNTSGTESQSTSESESGEEADNVKSSHKGKKHKNSARYAKNNGVHTKSSTSRNSNDGDELVHEQKADSGNWQAFQNVLLREDVESTSAADRDIFSSEKEIYFKRRQNATGSDPILTHERDLGEVPDKRMLELVTGTGKGAYMYRQKESSDELRISREGVHLNDNQLDIQFTETESGGGGYKRMSNDDFMICGQENQLGDVNPYMDILAEKEYDHAGHLDKSSAHNMTDESYMVPFRSSSPDRVGVDSRTAIDMDSEFPPALQRSEERSSDRIRSQSNYEPDDLSLMPERGMERESIGFDLAVDYEMEVLAKDAKVKDTENGESVVGDAKEGLKKLGKVKEGSLEKRKVEPMSRKGKPSRLNPLAEAQLRAEKLRAFKADLQKEKKEKEEEEVKRLEALKRERQKRIAARGTSSPAQSPLPRQTKSQLPARLSPNLHKGSKFSDSEPGYTSPVPKLNTKTSSMGPSDFQKISRPTKGNGVTVAGSGLSRSFSSLPEMKKENIGITEPKAASTQPRRLSDPKGSSFRLASSQKSVRSGIVGKPKVADEPETKKMSAIVSLDRTKSDALPKLKVRTSKGPSGMANNKTVTKETTQKGIGTRSSLPESTKPEKGIENGSHDSHHINGDDSQVIEKTVVMLEQESASAEITEASEEQMELQKGFNNNDKSKEKSEVVSAYAAIRAPPSPIITSEVDQSLVVCQIDEQPPCLEVKIDNANDGLAKYSRSIVAEANPYQAPFARSSSLEDPCTSNVGFGKEPPISSNVPAQTENTKLQLPDFRGPNSPEHAPEALEKPRGKESLKGIRKLLKFGKKNQGSSGGESNVDSDKLSVDSWTADDQNTTSSFSSDVPTLKNLISQDESPLASTATKVSRPFSLLSPFRSKTSEKRLST